MLYMHTAYLTHFRHELFCSSCETSLYSLSHTYRSSWLFLESAGVVIIHGKGGGDEQSGPSSLITLDADS